MYGKVRKVWSEWEGAEGVECTGRCGRFEVYGKVRSLGGGKIVIWGAGAGEEDAVGSGGGRRRWEWGRKTPWDYTNACVFMITARHVFL